MLRSRTVNSIHDLAAQGTSIHGIARTLGIARNTVRKYLRGAAAAQARPPRPSKLDPFKEQIRRWVVEDRLYNCETMLQRLQAQGYTGRITMVRAFVHPLRPAKLGQRPVQRYETPPGEQLQFDWAEFLYEQDGAPHKLFGFTAVLSYSRMRFVTFVKRCDTPALLRCLMAACEYFGGLTRAMLTDRMKSVLLTRTAIRCSGIPSSPTSWRRLAWRHASAGHIRLRPKAKLSVVSASLNTASGPVCALPISTISIAKRGPGAMIAITACIARRANARSIAGQRKG